MIPQDIADLKLLIEFLKANQVAEFDLDREDVKLHLKFAPASILGAATSSLPAASFSATPIAVSVPVSAPVPAAGVAEEDGLHALKSPLVGTFYSSPSPGAATFVTVGSTVQKGQVIAIVEAMKLMNEIEADASGTIVKCLVPNGQPVEYGQPLFLIRQN